MLYKSIMSIVLCHSIQSYQTIVPDASPNHHASSWQNIINALSRIEVAEGCSLSDPVHKFTIATGTIQQNPGIGWQLFSLPLSEYFFRPEIWDSKPLKEALMCLS